MKNKLMNIGVLTCGLCIALVMSPMDAGASEDDLMVDVNVLNKVEGKSSVLDVEISDVPIVDDVNVNIPSDPEAADSEAVATVEVSDGVMDELDVEVLGKTDTEDSVATVELESSLTDDVTVDVVSGEKTSSAFDGGVVEVNAEDLVLLGETHVGVLDRHTTAEEEGKSFSAGLIQANLDDGLLDDASIDVLAVEEAEAESEERATSAVVDVIVDDEEGLLDDLGVSVLKREESETGTKSSLASVDLEVPVTDDLDVDVALRERTSNTFDDGLVEVNGEDLPLLGETHVGVLDRHVTAEEEEKSFSAGLIQADLNEGLVEDTSVGVLVRKMTTTEDGRWVSDGGASLDVGLPGTETVSTDVLTRERFFSAAQLDAPTEVVPPVVDEETGDTSAPEEDGVVPAVPESGNEGDTADVDEEDQGTVMPPATEGGAGADDSTSDGNQGTTAPPVNDGESMENDAGVPGAMDEAGSESAADNGWSGDVDADFGSRTGEFSGMADASAISDKGQSSVMNGFAMNNADPRSSLPKTGGFWDGKRLAFLAMLLVVAGLALRRLGKSIRLAA